MPFKHRTRNVPVNNVHGEVIGYVKISDTTRRWRALFWWCLIFTIAVSIAMFEMRQLISSTNRSKADVTSLKTGGCNIRIFLVSSRSFRLRSYHDHKLKAKKLTGEAKKTELVAASRDLAGARLAKRLADNFAPSSCVKELGLDNRGRND